MLVTYIEEGRFRVEITLVTYVDFSPIERDSRLTNSDAIANAFGLLPDDIWETLEGEGFSIDSKSERIS